MRTMRAADGMTFPVAYVESREADVPILAANSALLRPELEIARRISAATEARSLAYAPSRIRASTASIASAIP